MKLGDKNDSQYQIKIDEEMKRLEKYLNNLFPEKIQMEQEVYDPKIIEQQKDPAYGKKLIQSKL